MEIKLPLEQIKVQGIEIFHPSQMILTSLKPTFKPIGQISQCDHDQDNDRNITANNLQNLVILFISNLQKGPTPHKL